MNDPINDALAKLDEMEREVTPLERTADPGVGVKITEAMVDREMVRRGLAHLVVGGFVGDDMLVLVKANTDPSKTGPEQWYLESEYQKRREQARADLEAFDRARSDKAKGSKRANVQRVDDAEKWAWARMHRRVDQGKTPEKGESQRLAAEKYKCSQSALKNRMSGKNGPR